MQFVVPTYYALFGCASTNFSPSFDAMLAIELESPIDARRAIVISFAYLATNGLVLRAWASRLPFVPALEEFMQKPVHVLDQTEQLIPSSLI